MNGPMKKFLLAAMMMLAAPAFGASPTATLQAQIVPAQVGMACDIGPPYQGAIPAGAQAAGFTHCAANYDFTNAAYASLSNWLDCAGASNPQWYNTLTNGGGNRGPCSNISITADGGAPQVLHEVFRPVDASSGVFGTTLTTTNDSLSSGTTFPLGGAYYQSVYRVPASTYSAVPLSSGIVFAWWSWETPQVNVYEGDFQETYSDGGGPCGSLAACGAAATYHNHGNDGEAQTYVDYGNGNMPTFDPTVYNSYGTRMTFDGTSMVMCSYLNGNFSACSNSSSLVTTTPRRYAILMLGPQGSPTYVPTAQQDAYIKSVTIFTCGSWQSGQCTGSVLNGPP